MARIDKYDPISGGFRAALAADKTATTGIVGASDGPIGVGLDANGRVVPGAGQTGIKGVLVLTQAKKAGDIVDIMTDGEIVEAGAVAGTNYFAAVSNGVLTATQGAGLAASLATGVVGSNNAITWTAKDVGAIGNGVSVQLKDPAAASQALGVVVTGNDIVVNLATSAGSAITSTATLIIAAIVASAAASALVTAANTGASSGAGVVAAVAATNLAGGAEPDEASTRYVGHTVEAARLVVRTVRDN